MIDAGFYNMDCMEAMKQFPDGFFDLAIVDPPYGINVTGRHKAGAMVGGRERPFGGKHTNTNDRGGTAVNAGVCALRGKWARAVSAPNFTTPSTINARRTKAISESLSASRKS